MNHVRVFSVTCGFIGGTVTAALGGWSSGLQTLLIFMVVDYASGLIDAIVFKKSPKTTTGAASSRVMLKGIIKKVGELILVLIAYQLDRTIGIDYIRDMTIVSLTVTEAISIVENLGLMGVPLPGIIKKAIDMLESRSDEAEIPGGNDGQEKL